MPVKFSGGIFGLQAEKVDPAAPNIPAGIVLYL